MGLMQDYYEIHDDDMHQSEAQYSKAKHWLEKSKPSHRGKKNIQKYF